MDKSEQRKIPGDGAEERREPSDESGSAGTPAEIGGRDGPDPTRYGDWEKAGRCIDF